MTAHRTMNTVAHAAFRRDLGRFDAALADFPAGSQTRADQLSRAWEHFESELHHHHDYEEEYFWPALVEVAEPALLTDLGGEHDEMRVALGEASGAMKRLHGEPTAEHADVARSAVAHLGHTLVTHLEHEELTLEPISAQHAGDPPMRAATKKVIKAHRGRLGNVLAWMQDGADDDARRFIRHEIPPPVVFVATTFAGRKYRRDVASVWS